MNQKLINYLKKTCEYIKLPPRWWKKLEAEIVNDRDLAENLNKPLHEVQWEKKFNPPIKVYE